MKSYIKFLTFIVFITPNITKPSEFEGLCQVDDNRKVVAFGQTLKKLKKLAAQEAQKDINSKLNIQDFYQLNENVITKWDELKKHLNNNNFKLSLSTQNKIYLIYEGIYNDAKAKQNNQSSYSIAPAFVLQTKLLTSAPQKPISNDDLRYVAILLKTLNPENSQNDALISFLVQKIDPAKRIN